MSHSLKPRSRVSQSRVWVYFKQCDGDPDKARCNLCSVELCHRGTTNVLWNHVKIKHSIDRNTLSQDNRDNFESSIVIPPAKQTKRPSSKTKSNNNNHSQHQNNTANLILDYNDLSLVASMKPLPSTSLSENLIARLNQLSSPLTRKLKFWNKKSFQVNQYDPSFKVIYLGNLGVQLWSKDESCLDKPLSTLWNNYLVNMKTEIVMRLTICNSGLKAITRQHGLTQYWSNRLVYCCSHKNYPRIFSWVYRHEGKKMRQELRCHAVFCPSPEKASRMVTLLNERIACALQEFRREKKSRSSSTIVTQNESPFHQNLQRTVPLRRQILTKGSANFRPPLERSKSAPKLTSILEEEDYESSSSEEEEEDDMAEHGLHDVFEYEESFGDKDDDDDDDHSDDIKIESNSLNTTVNEETSNSSAYATSDRSSEKRNSEELNQIHIHNNHHQNQNHNHNHNPSSHTNQNNKSANTNTIRSSSPSSRQEINDNSSKLLLVNQSKQAKNNNVASSNKNEPPEQEQSANDAPTNEIILSWSNLVIK